jgi:hypothetical protein
MKSIKGAAVLGAGLVALVGLISAAHQPAAPSTNLTSTPTSAVQGTQVESPATPATQQTTPAPQPEPAPAPTPTPSPNLSNSNAYTNVDGDTIHSPAYSTDNSVPVGATAQCGDGTYSFSTHRSGTCSHHGGVTRWL